MLTNLTMAGVFRPGEKKLAAVYDIALILAGSLLIGLCARIAIRIPISPVPITAQTFAVLIIAALLGSRRGSLCVLAYLIEGALGLPVFALGAGLPVLVGPTAGYLVGFVFAAYLTGRLAEKGWDRRVATTILAMTLGNAVIYVFGMLWLCRLIGTNRTVLAVGLYPFVVGDCLKIALAAATLPAGWKLLRRLRPDIPAKSA